MNSKLFKIAILVVAFAILTSVGLYAAYSYGQAKMTGEKAAAAGDPMAGAKYAEPVHPGDVKFKKVK